MTADPPGELTSIDHILQPPELKAKVEFADFPHHHDPLLHPDHFPVVVRLRLPGGGGVPSGVRIASLLPNPPGNENQHEAAEIKNSGTRPVNLSGWKLRDLADKMWSLADLGTLTPNGHETITRSGQPMAMNNGRDTIDLIDSDGRVVHTVTYGAAEEGETVIPPP